MLAVGYPEDAVVGSWLIGTKCEFVHTESFHDVLISQEGYRPCARSDILLHHMDAAEDWERVDSAGMLQC